MIFGVIGAVFVVLGVVMVFLRRRSAEKQAASLNWPTVAGTIVDSGVHAFRSKRRNNYRTQYTARIGYTYQIGGKEHRSQRIAWGGSPYSNQQNEAEATVSRYPVGSTVRVHYNPEKVEESVLEPKETGGLTALIWIAVAFIGIGSLFFVLGFFVLD